MTTTIPTTEPGGRHRAPEGKPGHRIPAGESRGGRHRAPDRDDDRHTTARDVLSREHATAQLTHAPEVTMITPQNGLLIAPDDTGPIITGLDDFLAALRDRRVGYRGLYHDPHFVPEPCRFCTCDQPRDTVVRITIPGQVCEESCAGCPNCPNCPVTMLDHVAPETRDADLQIDYAGRVAVTLTGTGHTGTPLIGGGL